MSSNSKENGESSKESKTKRPLTSEMVNSAIKNLNDRGGSSLKAIAKYMDANYSVEVKKRMPYVKAYIKKALLDGTIIQKSGIGLSGSFKLANKAPKTEVKKAKPKTAKKDKTDGEVNKEKAKKSKVKKIQILSGDGTKKMKQNAGKVKAKKVVKGKIDETKKVKANTKSESVKKGKVMKVESKKSKAMVVNTTDSSKLKKIRISILNGKLIKRKSVGAKNKKPKTKKVVEEP